MSSLIKHHVPKTPAISPPVTAETPEVKEAASAEALRLRKKRGWASSILTGAQGIEGEAKTKRETLG